MAPIAFTAPHAEVARMGQGLLAEGATAVDAMVAASAAIAVAYPHMNSLGGDGFWLIQAAGKPPVGIDACGFAAQDASIDGYRNAGLAAIPPRGPMATLCQAGTLDGWRLARKWSQDNGFSLLPLPHLLAPAVKLAEDGIAVTVSLQAASEKLKREVDGTAEREQRDKGSQPRKSSVQAFVDVFQPDGRSLRAGDRLRNPALARFLRRLAARGTEDFYRGALGAAVAEHLASIGSPLRWADFRDYRARPAKPLSTSIAGAEVFNLPPPTQGIASLIILAIYDRLRQRWELGSEAARVHCLVEATKLAFRVRDREVGDPSRLSATFNQWLSAAALDRLAAEVREDVALPWPERAMPGDTVWMGALDRYGTLVSFIQSLYWEFGSGVVVPEFGLVWNNRGLSFQLDTAHRNALAPRHRPLHTLNPALALLADGRRLAFGAMGGDGQPQTQAALLTRFLHQGQSLREAIARPRWLLGRTWGSLDADLKLERSLALEVAGELAAKGHALAELPDHSETMGHAGAICVGPAGQVEAASDPRSDGAACTAAS